MKHLVRLTDYTKEDVEHIFHIVDELRQGKYKGFLKDKTVVMFFPNSSIRTRVTFERGIYLLGGQSILFPPETLDKKEKIEDVIGYLNNWAHLMVIRHKNISLIEEIAQYAVCPIINGMTDCNHPCEVLADMYSLSKVRDNFLEDQFLFVGAKGNTGRAWKEAADLMGFSFVQSCPLGYEMEGVKVSTDLQEAIRGKDIICTDPLQKGLIKTFVNHQITVEHMERANKGAILNPCPPFYRGEEVQEEVIQSKFFVGYKFKKYLLEVQQAIMIYSLMA